MTARTQFIAALMLVGMLLQINSVLVCYALFFLNQKVIAETVCERKMTDCSGHCFLMKNINTNTETQQAPSGKPVSGRTTEVMLDAMPGLLPDGQHSLVTISCEQTFTLGQASFLPDGVKFQIDHPPKA